MIDALYTTRFAKTFIKNIKSNNSLLFEGLWDSPKAFLIHLLLKATDKDVVIITSGEREGKLYEDLVYFNGDSLLEMPALDGFSPDDLSPDIMGRRMEVLYKLTNKISPLILLTPLQCLLQKVISQERVKNLFIDIHVGEEMIFEYVAPLLTSLDYKMCKIVSDKGEFAIRDGIVDIFPISAMAPYRIEFSDDIIKQIRTFDLQNQRSTGNVDKLTISPANECALLLKEKNKTSILTYLPNSILIFDDIIKIEERCISLKEIVNNSKYFIDFLDLINNDIQKIFWLETPIDGSLEIFGTKIESKRIFHPFQTIESDFQDEDLSMSIYFLTENDREKEKLKEKFQSLSDDWHFIDGYLSSGFSLIEDEKNITIFPYTELSKQHKIRRGKWRTSFHTPTSEFHELEKGDLVVNFHNGIGRYIGMEKEKNHLGIESEFFIIEYANQSKLYVPATQSHLISRYIGAHNELPQLNKLGTTAWQKTQEKTQNAIIGYAKELLLMQAKRELEGGFSYGEDSPLIKQFKETFPYEETDDQIKAIADINNDMISNKSMDRLICGDVGYGKTEVAMRAACKAVCDGGKQVAILVPTTVLALQHYETFKNRFIQFNVTVNVISRFQTKKENIETLEKVRSGQVNILIGTHRLLSNDVDFKDLGLIIIDEEQRFGVRAKENLKKLKIGVDCITMTATPIPRTLYLSLIGTKKMSIINSPPQDRLPIKTIVCEDDEEIIKNALLREFSRDGQVYFIHNRVETIMEKAQEIGRLAPHCRIGIVHGQMDPIYIDDIFHKFKKGEIDILVATTIVESGLDIPNANTILIDRADRFGISDLYQLRGRVGRWNKSAYAYFLTQQKHEISEISQHRLSSLMENCGLGGGMRLAMRDLELRGAGDILGEKQSGHIANVGFSLYCKLLKRTMDALQKNKTPSFYETQMEFTYDAKISSNYISDSSIRLEIYHRLGEATINEEVDEILNELKDRFGKPPRCLIWLYHMTRIRVFATKYNYLSLKFQQNNLIAKRQISKSQTETKSIILPQTQQQDPAMLEAFVINHLSK